MTWNRWTLAALAVLAVGVGSQTARAGDVIRLGLNLGAPTVTLDLNADKEAETQAAFWRGGGRSFYGGYGSFYRPSFYGGGFGGGYSSFYRPSYYGGGFGYSSYYSRPSYYYGGYSSYYSQPSYYPSYYYQQPSYYGGYSSYYSPYNCPISMNVDVSSSLIVPGGTYVPPLPRMDTLPQVNPPMQPLPSQPLPQGRPNDGTFQYDGGPNNPVPMPQNGVPAQPQNNPNKGFVPGEGRLVSLPLSAPTPKYNYPAYGDNKK